MSFALPRQDSSIFRQRQQALCKELGDLPALIYAGGTRPRNYAAASYPYRSDSSFLYLVGVSLPDAVLQVEGGKTTLFVPRLPDNDALWHGEAASLDALRKATGVDATRHVDELEVALQDAKRRAVFGVLPCTDGVTRLDQARRFGKTWTGQRDAYDLDGADAKLADAMIKLRLRHDEGAIDRMRIAGDITVKAHRAAMGVTAPGVHEYEIQAELLHAFGRRRACEAYTSIVTVDGNVLHNHAYDNEMKSGDLLLVDAGADYEGWAADVTRTWPVNGRFSPTQRAMYEIVLQAQRDGIAMVKPGVRYRDIHIKCARTITQGLVDLGIFVGDVDSLVERGAHALFYLHGTGHLIGLDVHDMENFGDRAGYAPGRERSSQFGLCYLRLDRDFEPGMAVTIEPGFYQVPALLEGSELSQKLDADGVLKRDVLAKYSDVRGIRIEDDVLCTQNGYEVLTGELETDPDAVEARVGEALGSV